MNLVRVAPPVTGRTKGCSLLFKAQALFIVSSYLFQHFNLSPPRPPSPDQDEGQITFDVEMPSPRGSQVKLN